MISTASPPGYGRQGGFALVIVLWVLAGLTVVAVSIAATVQSNGVSVKLLRERLRAERAFIDTSSRLKVIAATGAALPASYLSERGEVFLDGRPTQVSDDESVSLQDARGLISLESPGLPAWRRLLQYCGANADEAEKLQESLQDYVDSDSLRRLHGAERDDYRAVGLQPPRNAPLLSRQEIWRVLGWAELRERWQAKQCTDLITAGDVGTFNVNTAPLGALLARGDDPVKARALIDARQAGLPYVGGGLLDLGQGDNPMLRTGGRAGDRVRVLHQMRSIEWALQYDLQISLDEPGGPWRLLEVQVVPRRMLPGEASKFPPLDFVPSPQDLARLNALSVTPFGS